MAESRTPDTEPETTTRRAARWLARIVLLAAGIFLLVGLLGGWLYLLENASDASAAAPLRSSPADSGDDTGVSL